VLDLHRLKGVGVQAEELEHSCRPGAARLRRGYSIGLQSRHHHGASAYKAVPRPTQIEAQANVLSDMFSQP
jgi:hypothetical protein